MISLLEIRSKIEHQGVLREVRKSFSFFVSLYFFPLIHILIKNNITEHSNICKIGKNCRSLGNM